MAEKIDAQQVEQHIKRWLREAFEAGRSLCEVYASQPKPPIIPPKPVGRSVTKEEIAAIVTAHEDFKIRAAQARELLATKPAMFLVPLNKAARWAMKWKEVAPEHAPIADIFLTKYKPGKELRDILEHDDEYLTGGGRFPDKMRRVVLDGLVEMSAFNMITVDGEILIGGTLSVQGMMQAAADFDMALAALRKGTTSD